MNDLAMERRYMQVGEVAASQNFTGHQINYPMQLGSLIPIVQFEDHIYEQNRPKSKMYKQTDK